MPESEHSHFIYVFDPVRPEMVTDPDAWTEEDNRIAEEHFAYLKAATEEGTVILAGRSLDGQGPAVLVPIGATVARSGPDYHLTTLAAPQGPPAGAGTSSGGSFVLTRIETTISSTRSGAGTYALAPVTGVEVQGNICVHLPVVMRNR